MKVTQFFFLLQLCFGEGKGNLNHVDDGSVLCPVIQTGKARVPF